jgi:hypothetical protein
MVLPQQQNPEHPQQSQYRAFGGTPDLDGATSAGSLRALALRVGLSRGELRGIEADLRERGVAECPSYAAWLRTEIIKRAQRKAAVIRPAAVLTTFALAS